MSHVYASTRPLFADGPQTPLHKKLEEYAYRVDIQSLMHEMMTELIMNQPEDPIPFLVEWLQSRTQIQAMTDNKEATNTEADV